MSDQENEVLNETAETVTQEPTADETLPPDALPPVEADKEDEAIPPTEDAETEPEVLTTSLSSAAFMAAKHARNLMDLLEALPDHSDFNMEIDEISMFLGRTMQSLNQKLA